MHTSQAIMTAVLLVGLFAIWRELYKLNRYSQAGDRQARCDEALHDDDPLFDLLQQALGGRTGRLRVSDAYLICGLEASKVRQDQIARFRAAIRALGWERKRCFFNGALQWSYVKGTPAEQMRDILVEYDPHQRSVRMHDRLGTGFDLKMATL